MKIFQQSVAEISKEFSHLDILTERLTTNLLESAKSLTKKNQIAVVVIVIAFLVFITIVGYLFLQAIRKTLTTLTRAMKRIVGEEGGLKFRLEKSNYQD